jgi:protein-tyrosine phosphatase
MWRLTQFVDIHTHVLPGIDDGPPALEDAVEMARAAMAAGTRTIAATPHLRADFPNVDVRELEARCQALRAKLSEETVQVELISGGEASLVWALEASDEEIGLGSYGRRGTDLLIETPGDVTNIEQLLYQLRARGFRVTLAHPERSPSFQREPGRLRSLSEHGVLLQVNAGALLAPHGSPFRRLAEHLCREGFAHVIASDGHRASSWRPVGALATGVQAATALVGGARAQWMASEAPAAVISGADLPTPPEIERPERPWRRRTKIW